MKRLLFFLVLIVDISAVSAQVQFTGKVQSAADRKSLGFASVSLLTPDSVAVSSTLTDINGDFVLPNVVPKPYRIGIVSMGYKTLTDTVTVAQTADSTFVRNYLLQVDTHQLDAVTVTASTVTHDIDHTTFEITSKDLAHATQGLDLMSKIPQLRVDGPTQKIQSNYGGNVKILINGANASEEQLKALSASDIKSIEYYDFPPAKYAGYSNVVNFITKHLNDGVSGGFDLSHALTTTFGNDEIYLNYNFGANQLSLDASTYLRGYSGNPNQDNYSYLLNGVQWRRTEASNGDFGYDDNYINLTYTRNVPDKYMFQVKFSPNFQHVYHNFHSTIEQWAGDVLDQRVSTSKSPSSQFTPSLDIYSSIELPKKQELLINVVGTYFNAKANHNRIETGVDTGEVELSDIMAQKNQKESVIGEVEYDKTFGAGTLAFGDNFSYGHLNSSVDQDNSLDLGGNPDYFTNETTNLLYGEFSGSKNKWSYRLQLGGSYYHNANNDQHYGSWAFQPQALVGYNFSQKFQLRAVLQSSTSNPSLGSLSDNVTLISDNIVNQGNPNLKNSTSYLEGLLVDVNLKWLSMNLQLFNQNTQRPINSYFMQAPSEEVISLRYENAKSSQNIGGNYSFRISPFKNDLFVFYLGGSAQRMTMHSSLGTYSYWNTPFYYTATFNYKGFSLSYQGNIVSWSLSGPYLSTNENASHLQAQYRYKDWTFSTMVYWLGTICRYRTKTIADSLVDYTHMNKIGDNRNMVTLGVAYRFNIGKKYNGKDKALQNSDTDAGLF